MLRLIGPGLACLMWAIVVSPQEVVMQGKYFIFFLSNCANLNSLRTFNDDATPIPLYLIADFCLCFLKSIVLYAIFYGDVPWNKDSSYTLLIGVYLAQCFLMSRFVIGLATWKRIFGHPAISYVVSIGDRLAQAGGLIVYLTKAHLQHKDHDHTHNDLLIVSFLAYLSIFINLVCVTDRDVPLLSALYKFKKYLFKNTIIYFTPYVIFMNRTKWLAAYTEGLKDDYVLRQIVLWNFIIFETLFFVQSLGHGHDTDSKQKVSTKAKKD